MKTFHKVVMVVDDEAEIRALLDVLLKRQGLVVMKAPNADLALHLVKSLRPNLFLLDIMMPGIDGFELCNRLRAIPHTADTPVIILSAYDTPQSRQRAIECGADAFVSKRELNSELLDHIHNLLGTNNNQHM